MCKHTWKECFLNNKNGPNYKKPKFNRDRNNNLSNDAYYQEAQQTNEDQQQQRTDSAGAEHFAGAGEAHVFDNRVSTSTTNRNYIWNPELYGA